MATDHSDRGEHHGIGYDGTGMLDAFDPGVGIALSSFAHVHIYFATNLGFLQNAL